MAIIYSALRAMIAITRYGDHLFGSPSHDRHHVAETEALGGAVEGALQEGRAKAPRPSAPGYERRDGEAAPGQHGAEGARREKIEMVVDGAPPGRAEQPCLKAVGVRGGQDEEAVAL